MNRIFTVLSGAFLVLLAGCDGVDDGSMDFETEQTEAEVESDDSETMADDDDDDADDDHDHHSGNPLPRRPILDPTHGSGPGGLTGAGPGGQNPAVCGNGVVEAGEACDDGNDFAIDGCDACELRPGLELAAGVPGGPSRTAHGAPVGPAVSGPDKLSPTGICGNGVVEASEQCDDANDVAADGCDACEIGTGELPLAPGAPDDPTVPPHAVPVGPAVSGPDDLSAAGICGNGVVEASEQCDDGNGFDADGCDDCVREKGIGGLTLGG